MNQTDAILTYMRRGRSIDPQTALRLFSSFRLAARIKDIRDTGVKVHRTLITTRDQKRFARYSLA
jgi:Helix-turn-helix domain